MRFLAWLMVFGLPACGRVTAPGGASDGGPDASDFALSVSPGRVFLRSGDSVDLDVSVERGGFEGAIEVAPDDLPPGVNAAPLSIADGESMGTLTLSATTGASQGEVQVTITGQAPGGTGRGTLRLLVGGDAGTLDQSFAGGKLVTSFGLDLVAARGVTLQPDGKIVGTASSADQAITYRLLTDGSIDEDFGAAGLVTTGIDEEPSCGGLVPVVLADGGIVVAGWGGPINGGYDSVLYGYTTSGVLDQDFGSSGVIRIDLGAGFDEFHGLLVDDDGGLLAGGVFLGGPTTTLRRYDRMGVPDGDYTVVSSTAVLEAAILLGDGKALLVGQSGGDFWLERHSTNGALDTGFGGDGQVTTDLGGTDSVLGAVEVGGGKVVAAGLTGTVVALVRYNGNGSPDLTFGDGGVVTTDIAFGARGLNALAMDSQGRFVLAGYVDEPQRLPAVVRLLADGTPDESFGTGGVAAIDLGVASSPQTSAFGLVIDADDRPIVSCDVGAPGSQQVGMVRLWP